MFPHSYTKRTFVAVVIAISAFVPRRETRTRNTSTEHESSSTIRELHFRGAIIREIFRTLVSKIARSARVPPPSLMRTAVSTSRISSNLELRRQVDLKRRGIKIFPRGCKYRHMILYISLNNLILR